MLFSKTKCIFFSSIYWPNHLLEQNFTFFYRVEVQGSLAHSLKLIDFSTGSPCRFDAYSSVDTILSHIILLFNNMPASPNDIINLQVMDNIKSKTFTNAAMQILNRYSKVAAAACYATRSMHKELLVFIEELYKRIEKLRVLQKSIW